MNTALLPIAVLLLLAQDPPEQEGNLVEVRVMTRANCLAGSKVKDDRAKGGFYEADNLPRPVPKGLKIEEGRLQLIAEPATETSLGKRKGMRLLLVNGTKEQTVFKASDSRLSIVQEAKDEKGEWKPVEYLPSSWCGNSYHRVFLGTGECWEFATPRYKGELKTKLRFALLNDDAAVKTVYSNEFDGSVNPEQFSEKQGHAPGGIMDPYND